MGEWNTPLPGPAEVNDPGHVQAHNELTDAIREVRDVLDVSVEERFNHMEDGIAEAHAELDGRLSADQLKTTISGQAVPRGDWADTLIRSQGMLAPPINTPTIAWSNGSATQMTSPVEYRPAICGIGSQTRDWDGKSDPRFRFHSGLFYTQNGGQADLALYGELKPGGSAQAAHWPVIVEFDTSAGVSALEVAFWGPTAPPSMRIEVGGLPVVGDYVINGPSGFGQGRKALLTFPDARARRIRIYVNGADGFYGVRVPAGESITKPTETLRTGAVIGDSFVNGAGGVATFPAGAGIFDTYALRVLKALGCNDFVLAGIGGSGLVSGSPVSNYAQRVSAVLGFNPDVLIVTGSINDGQAGAGVQSAAASLFDATESVSERYAIGCVRAGYEANHDALRTAAEAKGVAFVPMRGFLNGNGKVTAPTGDGNADVFIMGDGTHPTFSGHRALEQAIWRQISGLK